MTSPDSSFAITDRKYKPLRVWPAILLVAIIVGSRFGPSMLEDGNTRFWQVVVFGPMAGCGGVLLWWLCGSRATWKERIVGLIGLIAGLLLTLWLVDPTMRGPGTASITLPVGMTAFALGAVALSRVLSFKRTVIALILALLGFSHSMLFRSEGMTGNFALELYWRWSQSREEQLVDAKKNAPVGVKADAAIAKRIAAAVAAPEWPGFRGAARDGKLTGVRIASDWSANPPKELWRIQVGPGWSSFAVAGKFLFTQEQRGPMESVICYHADTGEEVWIAEIEARLNDPMGGPGPRATPTLSRGMLFVVGSEGAVMRLDPTDGAIVWRKELRQLANRENPTWGFSSSPLVVDGKVIVFAGGADGKATLALDVQDGKLHWSVAGGDHSYASPQLNRIEGTEVVLVPTNAGLSVIDPLNGNLLLDYQSPQKNYRALQPQVLDEQTLLLATSTSDGTRRLKFAKEDAGKLSAEEEWTTRRLKPDFNDFVVHEGNVYGFDGDMFTCVDAETGDRQWKDGRYGKGQVLLVADSDVLLVAGERGEFVLLRATPDKHQELAKMQLLNGKTWTHPVIVGDRLYVRNSQEGGLFRVGLGALRLRFYWLNQDEW